jgi:hypothetical protein
MVTRCGKRAGAGRKPSPVKKIKVRFSIEPDKVEAVKAMVKQMLTIEPNKCLKCGKPLLHPEAKWGFCGYDCLE